MLRTVLAAAACSLALAEAAFAAPKPPQAIWDSTVNQLDQEANGPNYEADLEERAPAWMTAPKAAMFTRLDVNGDGIDDWRVDFETAPNPSYFCGTGGCRQEVWVSEPGNSWRRVMGATVRDFKLRRRGGVTRLDLDFHGSSCDGYGVQECPRSYLWDADAGEFVETVGPAGQTWLSGGPRTLEPPNLESGAPPAVLAGLERMQMQCGINNGYYDPAGGVTRIPDIDGDGVRDWVIGSAYMSCDYAMEDAANASPKLPILVYASNGGGEGVLAYEATDAHYGIDMARSGPSAFYIIPRSDTGTGCEYEKPCGTRLRWDAATHRLIP